MGSAMSYIHVTDFEGVRYAINVTAISFVKRMDDGKAIVFFNGDLAVETVEDYDLVVGKLENPASAHTIPVWSTR